ncbi:kinase-like domain-containing protein [Hygrophoropsis aurantiaca]|uniref:Kinase-like domain-containing protein n=1 Tax=Hygrophoropsis aurantiaca TaxID=72124 RepID=A0ACB8AMA8_9AGAM|nr:kinase-like domain-containing protein [Hygrophoropsis aurantiaca]
MSTGSRSTSSSAGSCIANLSARDYSPRFPLGHTLHPTFIHTYRLCDELGSGGYGFVMTALHRSEDVEVAVKFIFKEKVPEQAWVEDETYGRLPMEVMLLSMIDHKSIVKCLDIFEDELFFYLVQELHGSPWCKRRSRAAHKHASSDISIPQPPLSPPLLSPSASEVSMADSEPDTPPPSATQHLSSVHVHGPETPLIERHLGASISHSEKKSPPPSESPDRPYYSRRPSYDLFECIEQTKHKRLSEKLAQYIMAQVVDAVYYLDSHGISHRDIKDENLVIDKNFKVKLIDFGSATIVSTSEPRPYYKLFFGTSAYAAAEVLLKQRYQAAPAEVWTLGVLMSYLLTGMSPFPTEKDAIEGRVVLSEVPGKELSRTCLHLLSRCLEPDPTLRADIKEVRNHPWLQGALDDL